MLATLEAERPLDDSLASFRTLVLADPALQDMLGEVEHDVDFAIQAVHAAKTHGLDLDAEDLKTALRTPLSKPLIEDLSASPGWLPAEIVQVDGRALVGWLYFGRRRLMEPFYGDSLTLARYRPFNRLMAFRTPLNALETWASALPQTKLHGLIFHMSRCGSTLAAQMLAAPPGHVVISEAAPIDAIVQLSECSEATKTRLLRAMVAVTTQVRNPGETCAFLKLDCWHTRDLPLFRRAFPETPWVFLYRDPVEVMISNLRLRGVQVVPSLVAPETFGLDLADGVPDEDYCARVLAAVCEAAVEHYPDGGGLVVDYRQMPQAVLTTILPHFGATISEEDAEIIRATTSRDAKRPEQTFSPDSDSKQQAATAPLRAISALRLDKVHQRLETLRAAQT